MPASGLVTWYLTDHLGSVRDLVDPFGAVLDHVKYDSFGRILYESNPTNGDRFKFTAREWEAAVDLYFYRARWYDDDTGRFVSEDPISFAAGDVNLYRYVGNSTTHAVDPSGLAEIEWESTFSEEEKRRIEESFARIRAEMPVMRAKFEEAYMQLSKDGQRKVQYEVTNALLVLSCVEEILRDTNGQNIEIYRGNVPNDNWAWLRPGFLWDTELHLNDRFGWTSLDDRHLDKLLFHELTHIFGTLDDDSRGMLNNAHKLEYLLYSKTLTPTWWYMTKSGKYAPYEPPPSPPLPPPPW